MNPIIHFSLLELLLLAGMIIVSVIWYRAMQLPSANKKIIALEMKMLACHREILELSGSVDNNNNQPLKRDNSNGLSVVS